MTKRRLKLTIVKLALLGAGALTICVWRRRRTVRTGPSLSMRATGLLLRLRGNALANPQAFRTATLARTYPVPAPLPGRFRDQLRITERTVDGRHVVTLKPRSAGSGRTIVYSHGGGYVNEVIGPHWSIVAALIAATGATVIVPFYPLAPEHKNQEAFGFMLQVYRELLTIVDPEDIVLVGDSAGGGFALGQAIEFERNGLPAPARLVLFSPWLDITLSDPAAVAIERCDPILGIETLRQCGVWWAAGDDPRAPRLSPLNADMRTLPPVDIYQGTKDLLVVDARRFVDRAHEAGAEVNYIEYPGAFHVFVGATFTAEAKDVFKRVAYSLAPTERPRRR